MLFHFPQNQRARGCAGGPRWERGGGGGGGGHDVRAVLFRCTGHPFMEGQSHDAFLAFVFSGLGILLSLGTFAATAVQTLCFPEYARLHSALVTTALASLVASRRRPGEVRIPWSTYLDACTVSKECLQHGQRPQRCYSRMLTLNR